MFKEEFEEELNRRSTMEDLFNDELKHIQKLALIGKLNPVHKQTLDEWRETHPERFENFCDQMDDEHRQDTLLRRHILEQSICEFVV